MDKNRSEVSFNNPQKKLKGLQNAGQEKADCADCGLPLMVFQLVTTPDNQVGSVITKVAVRCKGCGGYSYALQLEGQFFPGAANDHIGFDVAGDHTGAPECDVLFEAWTK